VDVQDLAGPADEGRPALYSKQADGPPLQWMPSASSPSASTAFRASYPTLHR